MRIDLEDCSIQAYDFTLASTGDPERSNLGKVHVRLSTQEEDYFLIGRDAAEDDIDDSITYTTNGDSVKPLIRISDDVFLLQSYDFCNFPGEESGMRIDLNESSLQAYNFTLTSMSKGVLNEDGTRTGSGMHVRISTEEEDWFHIGKDADPEDGDDSIFYTTESVAAVKPLIRINDSIFLLQSYNFSVTEQTGMRLDLFNSRMTAYNFYLEAGYGFDKTEDGKDRKIFIIASAEDVPEDASDGIKSDAQYYPVIIGDTGTIEGLDPADVMKATKAYTERVFKIGWDGSMIATQGRLGGWIFYEGPEAPVNNDITTANGDGWRSMYSGAIPSIIYHDDGTQETEHFYTVFDPKRDNVIAVGVPEDSVFCNHNLGRFRVLANGKMYCSDAHLGWSPPRGD
jgi:hypothetical protein